MDKPTLKSQCVRLTEHDNWLEITLTRPDKLNAFTRSMYQDMTAAIQYFSANDALNVALLNSEGRAFCAGNDISDFLAAAEDNGSNGVDTAMLFITALMHTDKPVVAAVQGNAAGIGTTLLLHTDLVIAADNARFHTAFIQLGLVPEAASSLLLPRLIGRQNASRLLLAGDTLTAKEAQQMGMIAYVVPDANLAEEAQALCNKIANFSAAALTQTKRLMGGDVKKIQQRIDMEKELFMERLLSPETQAIFKQFVNK